jgi:biotin carboxylase
MPTNDERPLIIIVRTGRREFREHLLRPLPDQYRVHMLVGVQPTWELPYIVGSTPIEDTLDTAEMVAAARALNSRDPVSGVLTWDESRTPQAAAVAAALGLPGGDVDVIARCRDKHLTRQALAAGGVPQPESFLASTPEEALAVADRLGYPVIIKPADLALSIGVVKATTPAEITAQFEAIEKITVRGLPDYKARVLVEEFAQGEEISIDCAVRNGEVFPLCVAHKEIGFPPYCVEVGHSVDGSDPLISDPPMLELLSATHAALGFRDGMTHTEIMLTPTGPKIIEVNGRQGGDLIPYLGVRATGVDVSLASAAVAAGRMPHVTPDRKLAAGVRFFHVARDNTLIRSVRFEPPDGGEWPEAVDRLVVLTKPGEIRSTPPTTPLLGRIAFATAVGESVAACRAALDAAEAGLVVEGEPVESDE